MKAPKVTKKIMNTLLSKMAEKQNAKNKLNAGQLREVIRIFLESAVEMANERQLPSEMSMDYFKSQLKKTKAKK